MRSAPVLLHRENVQVTFQKGKKLKLVISGEDSFILQFHGKLLNLAIFVIKIARLIFLYQSFTAFEIFSSNWLHSTNFPLKSHSLLRRN